MRVEGLAFWVLEELWGSVRYITVDVYVKSHYRMSLLVCRSSSSDDISIVSLGFDEGGGLEIAIYRA